MDSFQDEGINNIWQQKCCQSKGKKQILYNHDENLRKTYRIFVDVECQLKRNSRWRLLFIHFLFWRGFVSNLFLRLRRDAFRWSVSLLSCLRLSTDISPPLSGVWCPHDVNPLVPGGQWAVGTCAGAGLVFPRSRDSRLSSEQWSYLVPATRYSYQHQGGINRRQEEVVYNLGWAKLFCMMTMRYHKSNSLHTSGTQWPIFPRELTPGPLSSPGGPWPSQGTFLGLPGCLDTGPQSEPECGEARCDDQPQEVTTPVNISTIEQRKHKVRQLVKCSIQKNTSASSNFCHKSKCWPMIF